MGLDLYENTTLGKDYFDRANDIMGLDIQDIIFNGPEDTLKQTQYTQPAIYIVSVIIGLLLMEKGIQPSSAAGHSLGEYSALTLAKSFDFAGWDALLKKYVDSKIINGIRLNTVNYGELQLDPLFPQLVLLATPGERLLIELGPEGIGKDSLYSDEVRRMTIHREKENKKGKPQKGKMIVNEDDKWFRDYGAGKAN